MRRQGGPLAATEFPDLETADRFASSQASLRESAPDRKPPEPQAGPLRNHINGQPGGAAMIDVRVAFPRGPQSGNRFVIDKPHQLVGIGAALADAQRTLVGVVEMDDAAMPLCELGHRLGHLFAPEGRETNPGIGAGSRMRPRAIGQNGHDDAHARGARRRDRRAAAQGLVVRMWAQHQNGAWPRQISQSSGGRILGETQHLPLGQRRHHAWAQCRSIILAARISLASGAAWRMNRDRSRRTRSMGDPIPCAIVPRLFSASASTSTHASSVN